MIAEMDAAITEWAFVDRDNASAEVGRKMAGAKCITAN